MTSKTILKKIDKDILIFGFPQKIAKQIEKLSNEERLEIAITFTKMRLKKKGFKNPNKSVYIIANNPNLWQTSFSQH